MRSDRRGIVLPAVLAVLIPLSALSALALLDAAQELRIAALAEDRVVARARAIDGLSRIWHPTDLPELCLRPPSAPQLMTLPAAGGGALLVRWHHLGRGFVRADVEGVAQRGSRARFSAFLRPDSLAVAPAVGCAAATRLVPAAADWLEGHPEG